MKKILLSLSVLSLTTTIYATKKMCFTPHDSYPSGKFASAIVSADFNKDGKADIVACNTGDSTIAVLIGNGNGTFQSPVKYNIQQRPYHMACDDMDNDGTADLIIACWEDSTVSIFTGNGTGGFNTPYRYKETSPVLYVTTADFDKDGNKDIAAGLAQLGGGIMVVLKGSGNATVASRIDYPVDISQISIGYIDNDTFPDIVTTCMTCTSQVSTFLNNGAGVFKPAITYSFPSSKMPTSVICRDLTADGATDLAVSCYNEDSVYILRGNQTGYFTHAAAYAVNGTSNKIILSDLDNNGAPDLLVGSASDSTVSILMDNTVLFQPQYLPFNTSWSVLDLVSADFDGDGRMDIATVNFPSDDVSVLLNRSISLSTTYQGNSLEAVDYYGTFQWVNCDSNKIVPGATNKLFTPMVSGKYAVIVTNGNCSDTSTCNPVIVPGNVAVLNTNEAAVYPNPVNDILHLDLAHAADVSYSLQDIAGKIVRQGSLSGNRLSIDISNLRPGLYIIFLSGENIQQQFKISKQ